MKILQMFVLLLVCSFVTLQADEIHELVKNKDLVKIKKLVKENPQVIHSIDENGRTALHWACRMDQLDITTFLIDNHSDVNKVDKKNIVPLHFAAANGNTEACEMLLNKKAKIDKMNSSGDTPLHYAVSNGQLDAVKLLIKKGAAVNSAANDSLLLVSIDGKFLFYKSDKDGQTKIYWISTKIIQKLKQENMDMVKS